MITNYIQELGNNKVNFKKLGFSIDECGDNIVKALYLWDPESDERVTKNYKYYFGKVENEIMERDLILTQIKMREESETSDDTGWDFN